MFNCSRDIYGDNFKGGVMTAWTIANIRLGWKCLKVTKLNEYLLAKILSVRCVCQNVQMQISDMDENGSSSLHCKIFSKKHYLS